MIFEEFQRIFDLVSSSCAMFLALKSDVERFGDLFSGRGHVSQVSKTSGRKIHLDCAWSPSPWAASHRPPYDVEGEAPRGLLTTFLRLSGNIEKSSLIWRKKPV